MGSVSLVTAWSATRGAPAFLMVESIVRLFCRQGRIRRASGVRPPSWGCCKPAIRSRYALTGTLQAGTLQSPGSSRGGALCLYRRCSKKKTHY